MATCKNCFHYEACSGFKPTDLDKDVWHYCQIGIPEEIPDIDQRCDSFKDRKSWVEVVRCKDCKFYKDSPMGGKGCHTHFNGRTEFIPKNDNDFCSYGGKKIDEQKDC